MRVFMLLWALSGVLFVSGGCASHQRQPTRVQQVDQVDDDSSIERPAVPLGEETGLVDRIGEVGVVLLVVGIAIGLILIPILLL